MTGRRTARSSVSGARCGIGAASEPSPSTARSFHTTAISSSISIIRRGVTTKTTRQPRRASTNERCADNAHFAQENGGLSAPGATVLLPSAFYFGERKPPTLSPERRFHDLRGLVVTARDQVPIDIQGDCGISVAKPARDGQNVHTARDQH